MAFKLKHIASRFLLQSIFTIFLIGFLLFVFLFSTSRKEGALFATKVSGTITNHIEIVNKATGNALTVHKNEADFVSEKADKLLAESQFLYDTISNSIKELSEISFLNNYLSELKSNDSLRLALKKWSANFEQLVLSLKELGNKNGGKISSALVQVYALEEQLYEAPDNGAQYSALNELIADFVIDYDVISLDNLAQFCSNVSGMFYEYTDFDASLIEQFAYPSTESLLECKKIILRINNNEEETGQLPDLNVATINLNKASDKLITDIESRIDNYYDLWKWVIIIITLILAVLYLGLMSWFSTRVIRNIIKTQNNSNILASGDISHHINKSGDYEFGTINERLNGVQSYIVDRSSFVEQLLNNTFNGDLEHKSEYDKLSQHLNALKARMIKETELQKTQNAENEIRRYINEGLAKFAGILRDNSNDTNALGDNLIKELVKYLGALQGGLFLTNEEADDELNLISAFAFDRKKYMNKTLKKGEGLVGTCSLEKKTINITEIPKDYVAIKSGLGDTPPNNILILPVKHEESLVGVLELASLKIFNTHEIELAEQIASNLASTIITVRNNTKTAQLLEKSQQQAAEMREQEEEMRQNMEELKATQEESTRREDEMQGMIDAVGAGFYLIEYSTEGLIAHINSSLATFLEQPFESIIGLPHQSVFSNDSLVNNDVLNEVTKTKKAKKITEILPWGSRELKYTHTLSPILTRSGEVMKILNLLTIEEIETK